MKGPGNQHDINSCQLSSTWNHHTLSYQGGGWLTPIQTLNLGSIKLFAQGFCKNNFLHSDLKAISVFKVYSGFPPLSIQAIMDPKKIKFFICTECIQFLQPPLATATGGHFPRSRENTSQFDPHSVNLQDRINPLVLQKKKWVLQWSPFKKPKAFHVPERRVEQNL